MTHFSVAGLQLALSNGNNLAHIQQQVALTKKRFPWLDMMVLPELAAYGTDTSMAEVLPGDTETQLCQLAKQQDVWLVAGSLFEQVEQQVYNTCSVINREGEVVARYRKIFPFHPYEKGVSCGQDFVVVDVPNGRIGIAICYDLWFPEVARTLASMGAECLIYPTLTGTIDRHLEVAMSQTTAVQQQSYVLSVNCAGELGNGRSVAVGPDGDILHQAGENPEVIPIEIDFERVRRNRERGVLGLGQPLKSFRDNPVCFTAYQADKGALPGLNTLGELQMPGEKQNTVEKK